MAEGELNIKGNGGCIHYFCGIFQSCHGPLTRYVMLRVAHAPRMPGTFSRHRLQRKPLVSHPSIHHGACITQVPWCMSGSLTRGGGENVPSIPGACPNRNFTYLARGPCGQRNISCGLWWYHDCWFDGSLSADALASAWSSANTELAVQEYKDLSMRGFLSSVEFINLTRFHIYIFIWYINICL